MEKFIIGHDEERTIIPMSSILQIKKQNYSIKNEYEVIAIEIYFNTNHSICFGFKNTLQLDCIYEVLINFIKSKDILCLDLKKELEKITPRVAEIKE